MFLIFRVGFEPEIPVSNLHEISHALEFAATVIGCMVISDMRNTYKYHVNNGSQTRVHKNISLKR